MKVGLQGPRGLPSAGLLVFAQSWPFCGEALLHRLVFAPAPPTGLLTTARARSKPVMHRLCFLSRFFK